ncbi:hypothetical protein Tsubulata_033477 [Turnera subulata]|uniref:Uncharacterized protein n=1 Tax=Turnera subulata TaxID=218843 RepID=A0A9Q0JKB7_9ROSI|nr:hypothetical protein Tsubulata_033477 [Turnera subulata]
MLASDPAAEKRDNAAAISMFPPPRLDKTGEDFFHVRICSGKPMTIVASRAGSYPAGKRALLCHSLVSLLQQINRVFDAFGNLPHGFRANTWVVPPPVVADNP